MAPVLTPWQSAQVLPYPDAPRWAVAPCVYDVVYDGLPLVVVETWHVVVHPAASCQLEVACPGAWQSQHFWAPRAA